MTQIIFPIALSTADAIGQPHREIDGSALGNCRTTLWSGEFFQKRRIENPDLHLISPNPDKPEPNRFEDKKIDHESTKIRRHESQNVILFRAFNLSCFRDCVSEFSARKNAKIITKVLIYIYLLLPAGRGASFLSI
jgi:hypothetical protein